MELFIIGGVAFPFRLFDERVNDLLQQCGLKTEFHNGSLERRMVTGNDIAAAPGLARRNRLPA